MALQFEVYGLTVPPAETEAGLMAKMSACSNVYKAVHERSTYVLKMGKTDSDFRKNFPQLAAIYKDVKELRERINGKS